MFNNYYHEMKYIVDALAFQYRGGYYTGHGALTWKPETGFHFEAFLHRTGTPIPDKWGIGRVGIVPEADHRTIRMRLRHNGIAVAPSVPLTNLHSLYSEMHLDIHLDQIILLNQTRGSTRTAVWAGTSLCTMGTQSLLPDVVDREEKIHDEIIQQGFSRRGLLYNDSGNQEIIGYVNDRGDLLLTWRLNKARWTKEQSWAWPIAACKALSILSGEHVQLLQREFLNKERQRATEMVKRGQVEDLGILSLFDGNQIDKQPFIELTEFFVRNVERARICTNLFHQVLEASRQRSWQATELLLSTALEAALRSIDGAGFLAKKSKNKQWEIRASLRKFREEYLSDEWEAILEEILRAHFRLRDRNAHPDWLIHKGGAMSDAEMEKSLDDMILLARFYGYVILALAGKRGLRPIFPNPHRNWKPPISVEKFE